MNNDLKRKTIDKKILDTNNFTVNKKINKKTNEKQIKITNEKEIKIEDYSDDLNLNKEKNLSTINKSNLQKYKKSDLFSLSSTPKSTLKNSINEKINKYNTNITTFTSNLSNSQNNNKITRNIEISKKNLQSNFNNITNSYNIDKTKNSQPEISSSLSSHTLQLQNKNSLNNSSNRNIQQKDSQLNIINPTTNNYIISNSNLNSSQNEDSCSISQTQNISLNSNESIYSSPSKKLNQIKLEKIEDFKKNFESLDNFLKIKLKNVLNLSFTKILDYSNSDFILKFRDFKIKTSDFLNNFSLISSVIEDNKDLIINNSNCNLLENNNENLIFNTLQIHNYFEKIVNELKEKLNLPRKELNDDHENHESLSKSNNDSQDQSHDFLVENEFNISAISEDCLFEYENVRKNTKNNSLCLDLPIPIKRDRAVSENDESLNIFNILKPKDKSNFKGNYINEASNQTLNNYEKFEKMNQKNSFKNIGFEIDFVKDTSNIISINSENNSSNFNSVRGKNFELRFRRLNKKTRLSSEEMEKRIKEKLEQAEKNKQDLKKLHTENYNRTMMKIKDIKTKKKIEKIQKMQKLYKKIEKFNQRHQEYLNEKLSKVKSENEKIAEIKFLLKIDKENKNINLLKKLDISIDRRKKYIEQKLWKTKLRNKREEELIKSSKNLRDDSSNSNYVSTIFDDEIKEKFFNKFKKNLKCEIDKNIQTNEIDTNENRYIKNENNKSNKIKKNLISNNIDNKTLLNEQHIENCPQNKKQHSSLSINKNSFGNKIEDSNSCTCKLVNTIQKENYTNDKSRIIYNQKKHKLEENFEFIRTIYSENFIWELLEADYFDIDELCELSQVTKFELLKSKLKKDKEKIDKLYENKNNCNLRNDLNKNLKSSNNNSNINIFNNLNSKFSNQNFTSNTNNANLSNFANSNINALCPISNLKKQITINTDSVNSFINEQEKNYFNFEEQILANDSDEKDSFYLENQKKSRSFMHFDENEFFDYEYLFNDNTTKKNKKKKKKKTIKNNNKEIIDNINTNYIESNSVNNDDTDKIKNTLIKTINSMSHKTISTLYKSINTDNKKMKNYLVKSKDGKYLKSKIVIRNEDSENENKNQNKNFNYNSNKISNHKMNEKYIDQKVQNKSIKKILSSNNIVSISNISNQNMILNNDIIKKSSDIVDEKIENYKANENSKNINDVENESISLKKPKAEIIDKKIFDDFTITEGETNNKNRMENYEAINVEENQNDFNQNIENQEKLIKDIVSNNDISDILDINSSGRKTLMINSESVSKIIEQNAISIKWCKLCNVILPNDQESNVHLSKFEHKRLKNEYGISLQDDSNYIMVFQSLPGDINEDLKNERINSIKLRFKKIKQKLSLRAVKHENFWSYKQDFPSNNKQRLQKISFEIEKQIFPNIKDYEALENNLKETIRILDQKKINDLHIMRQTKIIHCLVEVLKKPAVCHKGEIKNLGKILEHVVKILSSFSTLLENRNYMIVTNRLSVIVDLLLWILNKPSKIPLGISFLPDLIYLITIHIKHRIPFEHLCMKDDFIEYVFLSNILVKFKQKYCALTGPIDLTTGFGSFPLFLLKSLGMLEAITSQININYCSKPVYIRTYKISDNILFVIEHTDFIGTIQLLYTLLLSEGPIKSKSEKDTNKVVLPSTVITASILAVKILNNIARIDLYMFQSVFENNLLQDQIYHIICYIINYSLEYLDSSDDIKELLHESILLINYITLRNEKLQNIFSRGEVTAIQRVSSLPFNYFCDKKLKDILFPTLISLTYLNNRTLEILNKEINLEMLILFLKEKIQLEPINEEEEVDKLDESREDILLSFNRDLQIKNLAGTPENMLIPSELKKRTMSISSSASSTKSCHDMITGVSDFVLFYHRFPRNLWENTLEFYRNFNQSEKNQ